jgi:hypothetical protein
MDTWRKSWPARAMRPLDTSERAASALRALTTAWSSEAEVACRAGRVRDGSGGDLYALERDGLAESRCSHTRRRQWRLTERGVAERRDLEVTSASTTEE